MSFGRRFLLTTTAAAMILTLGAQSPARADNPLAVAAIGAAGAVVAAGVVAAGTVAAAVITGGAIIVAGAISASSTSSGDGSDTDELTQSHSITGDAESEAASVTFGRLGGSFGEWIETYSGELRMTPVKDGELRGVFPTALLKFEGDVMTAPEKVRSFTQSERIVMDLKVATIEGAAEGTIALILSDLVLGTTDVPETAGYSGIRIEATSGEKVTTWTARAVQGKMAEIDKAPGSDRVKLDIGVLSAPDPVVIPIAVVFPDKDQGSVRIVITYEGSGRKT